MSLGNKVFFLFGALLAILLGSQWFMMRSITQDVSRELGQVAFSVGRDTASFFILGQYKWNDQLLHETLKPSPRSIEATPTLQSNTKLRTRTKPTKPLTQVRQRSYTYTAPSVEIRLDNQIKDDFLELITETGTQSIPIPRDGMIKTVEMLEKRMLSGTLIILVLGLIVAAYFSHRLSAPLRDLSTAAKSVASGELGTTINRRGRFISKEIKSTVESFNHMSKQLANVEELKTRIRENDHYRELGEIARGLAHSIRNPLNTLGLTIEELARDDLSSEKRESMTKSSSRQIERIDNWVKSFMTFSLSGDTEVSAIPLIPLIQDIRLEANQLHQRQIEFKIDLSDQPEKSYSIQGVEAEIKAIFHALIINAVEASPTTGTVTIKLSGDEESVNIEIYDQGQGIPDELKDKLFQPHQTTKARGSGMGLFMAHRLATNRYAGSIDISSNTQQNKNAEGSQDNQQAGTKVLLNLSKTRLLS